MRANHVMKDHLVRLAGLRIDGNHFAARIELNDGNPQTITNLKDVSQEVVLAVWTLLDPIDIKISSKPAPIHRQAKFLSKSYGRGIAENRDRATIIKTAFAKAQCYRFAAAALE